MITKLSFFIYSFIYFLVPRSVEERAPGRSDQISAGQDNNLDFSIQNKKHHSHSGFHHLYNRNGIQPLSPKQHPGGGTEHKKLFTIFILQLTDKPEVVFYFLLFPLPLFKKTKKKKKKHLIKYSFILHPEILKRKKINLRIKSTCFDIQKQRYVIIWSCNYDFMWRFLCMRFEKG